LLAVVGAVTALGLGVFVGVAAADYWDFSGYLGIHQPYLEGNPDPSSGMVDWKIRLSRQYCGTKQEGHVRGGGYNFFYAPNGCATSDWITQYSIFAYDFSMCYNVDGPTMWVNCRIDLYM
jgi:hypothetical protein